MTNSKQKALTNETKTMLSEIIISVEFTEAIADKIDATCGQVLRFVKNNIETIFDEMIEKNQPATIVIADLYTEQA